MGNSEACGVQVVSVVSDGTYSVCSEAVRSVVCRPELRSLPVAVVSVAGATRGGKSFLLDFFLRYLTATPSARSDGSWLGAKDEPLSGFSWRGGCERDTVGIQLWSEPFELTRANGDKVVVLLMDTQGTFDSSSTIQDSTTIFAMSTLLSSMQIFNISANIQEDHLQYLQLFTEYGKLAAENREIPFQMLQFLVRDWSYAYQHPVGAVGGKQLLEKRLQIKDNQPEELREIRQHIQSCFESVRCFLMPHPGLTVANSPNFNGSLEDISKEFKDALVELVHGLFEENLTVKKVSGQVIQAQELVEYFEGYMEVFNSEQVPTPTTIFKATSSACLEAALSAARDLYVTQMDQTSEARSVPRGVMGRLHGAAKENARQAFLARRTLAAPQRAAQRLDRLLRELDCLLANFVELNDIKVKAAIAASVAAYEKYMLEVEECLLLCELEQRHQEAVVLAVALFDASRQPIQLGELDGEDGENELHDEDRIKLQEELTNYLELHDHILQRNEAKISAAIEASVEKYEEKICNGQTSSICVHPQHLTVLHTVSKDQALALFESRWKTEESAQNEHRISLLNKINDSYTTINATNNTNNENAVQTALDFYKTKMTSEMGTELCLHPKDLLSANNTHYESTKTEFYRCRTYGNQGSGRDIFLLQLFQSQSRSFTRFLKLNNERNEEAVKSAHTFYEHSMSMYRAPNAVPDFLGLSDLNVYRRHKGIKPEAIRIFLETLRKDGPAHAEDIHRDKLINMINVSFKWLLFKIFGKGAVTIASLLFLRRWW